MKDLSPVLRFHRDKNPDAFVGFTYPPDTILTSKQAKEAGLEPGSSSTPRWAPPQLYKNVMTPAGAEGVLGMGSWNSKTSASAKAYFDAHTKKFGGKNPTAGPVAPAGRALEILTNAVKAQGPDRKGHPRLRGQTTHAQDHPPATLCSSAAKTGHAWHREPGRTASLSG